MNAQHVDLSSLLTPLLKVYSLAMEADRWQGKLSCRGLSEKITEYGMLSRQRFLFFTYILFYL